MCVCVYQEHMCRVWYTVVHLISLTNDYIIDQPTTTWIIPVDRWSVTHQPRTRSVRHCNIAQQGQFTSSAHICAPFYALRALPACRLYIDLDTVYVGLHCCRPLHNTRRRAPCLPPHSPPLHSHHPSSLGYVPIAYQHSQWACTRARARSFACVRACVYNATDVCSTL